MKQTLLLIALSLSLATQVPAQDVVENFEGGSNPDDWQCNLAPPAPWFATGGNPGGCVEGFLSAGALPCALFHPSSPGNRWEGDYRSWRVEQFRFDLRIVLYNNSLPSELYLVLGDDAGTPSDFSDDALVYRMLDAYVTGSQPWQTYSYNIASQSAGLPAGLTAHAKPGSPLNGMSEDEVWNAIITDVNYIGLALEHPVDPPYGFFLGNATIRLDNVELRREGLEIGSSYCPGQPNSTGAPATMTIIGSETISANAVNLHCEGLPPYQFGSFLTGQTQGFTPNPGGSQGDLCLAGDIGRYFDQVGNSGNSGTLSATVDLNTMPVNPAQAVLVGETWNFQCWYRDVNPASTSNFSDAVAVTFQ